MNNAMEVDYVTSDVLEDADFEVEENDDGSSTLEGERCGLCMEIVIDRGVLDCCQHWFCFACIDNWASITNLCPLCQNEFQSVACVPVYDTIGTKKVDDGSIARDEEWYIEGKSNTLSFQSYYIDENAVICLDGDECKIRNKSGIIEGDSNLDTSIACDSCDLWYHAICVGFDTETTYEDTWLCPRCVVNMTQKSDATVQTTNYQHNSTNGHNECLVEVAVSGKVCVSVADAGETAVVVSMIGGNQQNEESSNSGLLTSEVDRDLKTQTFIMKSNGSSPKAAEKGPGERTDNQSALKAHDLELSLSHGKPSESPFSFAEISKLETSCAPGKNNESSSVDENEIPSRKLCNDAFFRAKSSESDISMGRHLGLSVSSFMSEGMALDGVEDQSTADAKEEGCSEEILSKAEKVAQDATKDATGFTGVNRRLTECSSSYGETKGKTKTEIAINKVKDEETLVVPSRDQVKISVSDDSNLKAVSLARKLNKPPENSDSDTDIMSIVQGTDRKTQRRFTHSSSADNKEREKMIGLRVKKIVGRVEEDEETSTLVQKLRKEIRDAVRNRSSKDIGENLFDPKLLAAFRTAVAVTKHESVEKLSPSAVNEKKSMLQRGKIRENLTKKIYATSNGKRKRAWVRDCEIEFWKHRCKRATKPEKIETLKSVLDLLRKNSERSEVEEESGESAKNTILSRLYLADTSVFPRKDDIKPLTAVNPAKHWELDGDRHESVDKGLKKSNDSNTVTMMETRVDILPSHTNCASSKSKVASTRVHPSRCPEKKTASFHQVSEVTKKEARTQFNDLKSDKQKWALEVLARKKAGDSRSSTLENQEDNAMLKKNYPLLAQLPKDMRPVLVPCHHNKIPISIRQAQLYRLAEHFLKRANLPVICRTAATELAVADAINIEKATADRSNSKLVYVNLCSQELLHRKDDSNLGKITQPNSSTEPTDTVDRTEHASEDISTDPEAEEALREAGLLSDSPPNSPHKKLKVISNGKDSVSVQEDEPDNLVQMDSHSELHIYGNLEYGLDNKSYSGGVTANFFRSSEEDGGSEMKPHFSTLDSQMLDNPQDSEKATQLDASNNSGLLSRHSDAEIGSSGMDAKMDKVSEGEVNDEPSVAECKELHEPDKEAPINRSPDAKSRNSCELVTADSSSGRKDTTSNENSMLGQSINASDLGSDNCTEFVAAKCSRENSLPNDTLKGKNAQDADVNMQSDTANSVYKKVEAYIKEHIRPLCKSGVITAEEYRWAVAKTTGKVMKHHSKATNAKFLIKEGDKVKKLAEQYVGAAQKRGKDCN